MTEDVTAPAHAVVVIGGACSGSVVAEVLAQYGCKVVVFDQNARPYGKIEDGLPRWHTAQRLQEYDKINARLDHPNVTYVPLTKLGRDVDFMDLAKGWGWSALVLANGAWKDRPLDAPGADEALDRGLVYQNPFVYWFNHKNEANYDGPRYEVTDGAVVLGGGLASIDVIKIIQLELYGRALRARGIAVDDVEMEHQGIPKYCQAHGIDDVASLGVKGGLLVYRRRVIDMPLADAPKDASEKRRAKLGQVREKILSKCQKNFLFQFEAQVLTKELLLEDGRLRAVSLWRTQVEGRDATPIQGSELEVATSLVISSIGSVPEPIPGIEMGGTYYKFKDWDTGEYEPIPGVFAAGNVITGQGNIKVSLDHGRFVGSYLAERYLGVADDRQRDVSAGAAAGEARGAEVAAAVGEHLQTKAPLPAEAVNALLARARARQREVDCDGDYAAWIKRVTPPDMQ